MIPMLKKVATGLVSVAFATFAGTMIPQIPILGDILAPFQYVLTLLLVGMAIIGAYKFG